MRTRTIFTLAALAALAACQTPVDTAGEPSFGQSVAAMHEAQTISTAPQAGAPEGSGAVGADAQQRYQQGTTRRLQRSATSSQ
jgi:hypothetical protein